MTCDKGECWLDGSPGNPATLGEQPPGQDRGGGAHDGLAGPRDGQGGDDSQAHLHSQGQPTIYDVARAAGVSIASVSRVSGSGLRRPSSASSPTARPARCPPGSRRWSAW